MKRLFFITLVLLGITATLVPKTVLAMPISTYKHSSTLAAAGDYIGSFLTIKVDSTKSSFVSHSDSAATDEHSSDSGGTTIVKKSDWNSVEQVGDFVKSHDDVLPKLSDELLKYATHHDENDDVNTDFLKQHKICVNIDKEPPVVGSVPEPNTIALLGLGLALISFVHFRKV